MPIQLRSPFTFSRADAPPLATKVSQAARAILMGLGLGSVAVPKPDYRTLSAAAYEKNVFIYSIVNKIARAVSTVPWVLYERPTGGVKGARVRRIGTPRFAQKAFLYEGPNAHAVRKAVDVTEIYDDDLLTLIEQPNASQAQADYFEWLVSYLLLSGNAYEEFVVLTNLNDLASEQPSEMWALRPDRVEIIPIAAVKQGFFDRPLGAGRVTFSAQEQAAAGDLDGLVFRYDYRCGGAVQPFAAQSIIHHKFFHPTDDFYGLSPLMVSARAWLTDNLANDWNWALLKNEGRPSGALIAPTTVDEPTYQRVKAEIEEATSGGSMGKPLFLEGGMKWEPFGFSPVDLDWQGGKSELRLMMCAAFNTPPELAGSTEHRTYNSMPEARKAWWMEANLPILTKIRDSYNLRLTPRYGDRYFLDFDRDQIDALQEDRTAVWQRVRGADWMTLQEQRDTTGHDPIETSDPQLEEALTMPRALLPAIMGVGVTTGGDGYGGAQPGVDAPGDSASANGAGAGGDVLDEPTKEVKAQSLNWKQRRARARMRAGLAKYFREMGRDLANHAKAEVRRRMGGV